MKRIVFFLILLSSIGIATAQITLPESGWTTVNTPNNQAAGNSLIRTRNANEAITYFEVGGVGLFTRVGLMQTFGQIELNSHYHVNNFRR